MLNDHQIFDRLQRMPEPLKAEVIHYMDYLLVKYDPAAESLSTPKRQPAPELAGALSIIGEIV